MEAELYNEQPHSINIDLNARSFLQSTAKWGKFLAIIGFVFIGFMVVGLLFGSAFFSAMSEGAGFGGSMGGGFFSIMYLVFALLYFFPVLYLYKFSTKMESGLKLRNEELVTDSFKNLKSLFKFMGVLTIVMLAFYALLFLAVSIGGLIGLTM